MKNTTIYKVTFLNRGEVCSLYAKEIFESELRGFIELEEFVFDNKTSIIDIGNEKLKEEFGNVLRSFIPIQHVLRIDEIVEYKKETKANNIIIDFKK